MTKKTDYEVIVNGSGKTKNEAFVDAISKIQKNVVEDIKGTVMRIEPKDVEVLEAQEERYTERFLVFFFKRERSKFTIKLKVTVDVAIFDPENVDYKMIKGKDYLI